MIARSKAELAKLNTNTVFVKGGDTPRFGDDTPRIAVKDED